MADRDRRLDDLERRSAALGDRRRAREVHDELRRRLDAGLVPAGQRARGEALADELRRRYELDAG